MVAALARYQTVSVNDLPPMFSASEAMQAVSRLIDKVAGKNVDVLLLGESGTGKELIARLLHKRGANPNGPFIGVNLAALPATLIEAELFGVERGAFTGASERRAGRFEQASGGTLFLDEIGELPLELQSKMLRVLQEREVVRVGGSKPVPVTAAIVAATNRSLENEVRAKRFREDLFYRLNVFPIELPPLRARPADIGPLARHFAYSEGQALRGYSLELDDSAVSRLEQHAWPGNVRELKNTMARAIIMSTHPMLTAGDFTPFLGGVAEAPLAPALPAAQPLLPAPHTHGDFMTMPLEELVSQRLRPFVAKFCEGPTGDLYQLVLAQTERALFRLVLEQTGGNQLRAADILGLNRNTLRVKLRALGVSIRA